MARSLTTHQKAVLIQVLLAFPEQEVGVWYSPSASEGLAYAQDFVAVFKAIGWKVTGLNRQSCLQVRRLGWRWL